jgi:hypothetical protein
LKTTKKANVASAPSAESFAKAQTVSPKRFQQFATKRAVVANAKRTSVKRNLL